jgi:predicted enzyme related to lactoylglutathione lyase
LTVEARFVHTNLIAEDWRRLAGFYEQLFGCTPVPPARDLKGSWLELATGIPDASLQGIHLRLPGYAAHGPTLEIFQYNQVAERAGTASNRPGFAHIAFSVTDVKAAKAEVLAAGGGSLGRVVTLPIPSVGSVTFAYVTDPEGNIIELQHWSGSPDEAQPAGNTS